MNGDQLVEFELRRHDWSSIEEASGVATDVPSAITDLLNAKSPESTKGPYWRLENHVVVQGGLYESAKYVVPVVLAALLDPDRPRWVRIQLVELLFQIINGEGTLGEEDLGEKCRQVAREGLWMFYRIFARRELPGVGDILDVLETDRERLHAIVAAVDGK